MIWDFLRLWRSREARMGRRDGAVPAPEPSEDERLRALRAEDARAAAADFQRRAVVCEAALRWLDAHEAMTRADAAFGADIGDGSYDALVVARRTARNAMFRVAAAARSLVTRSTVEDIRIENERLRAKIARQQHELTAARLSAERRNRDLDALHLVWCNGGCGGGVHRYCGKPEDVTEEVVAAAERNTTRLRTWFENRKLRMESGGG